ncbi:hypothetical protein AB0878_44915 [Amycolatopsis sp. NPDC047767]|uniref:hypothetical protein n=1 Tax=Amycolatopsis sp. NPDC047767 TaxID=3156765 RepID=UPI003455638D
MPSPIEWVSQPASHIPQSATKKQDPANSSTPVFDDTVAAVTAATPPTAEASEPTPPPESPAAVGAATVATRAQTRFVARIDTDQADAADLVIAALTVLTKQLGETCSTTLADQAGTTLARFGALAAGDADEPQP